MGQLISPQKENKASMFQKRLKRDQRESHLLSDKKWDKEDGLSFVFAVFAALVISCRNRALN